MMIGSYFQSTYNSGRMAQTYLLASKVKAKLTQEAVRNDVDLHRLVCQANLLDNLIENLNHHESNMSSSPNANNNSTISYNSINSNAYPLLNNVTVQVNNLDYADDDEDDLSDASDISDSEDDQIEGNELRRGRSRSTCSEIYYTSDDSDFDSDEEPDDDQNEDELCCVAALQRLNFHSGDVSDDSNNSTDYNTSTPFNSTASESTYTRYQVHEVPFGDNDNDEEEAYSDVDSNSDIEQVEHDYTNEETTAAVNNGFCGLVRMHSQHQVLNIENYVQSVISEVEQELEEELEELEEEIIEEIEEAREEIHHELKESDSVHEEELPSLSNCSSLSSMEEIKLVNQSLTKLESSNDLKNQHVLGHEDGIFVV